MRMFTSTRAIIALSVPLAGCAGFEPESEDRIAEESEALAEAETTGRAQTVVQRVNAEGLKEVLRELRAANASTGEEVGLLVDPPLGGCDWQSPESMLMEITAFYLGNTLAATQTNFRSRTQCFPTAPGQTMKVLTDVAKLHINSQEVSQGNAFECASPPSAECTLASSQGSHLCISPTNCSGAYQTFHHTQLTLPDGWLWTSFPQDVCTGVPRGSTITCFWFTGTLVVAPTP